MGAQLDADVAIAGEVQVRMVAFSFSDILHTVEELDRLLAIIPSRGVTCTMFTCESRKENYALERTQVKFLATKLLEIFMWSSPGARAERKPVSQPHAWAGEKSERTERPERESLHVLPARRAWSQGTSQRSRRRIRG